MALKGKSVIVQISIDDITFYVISQINEVNAPFEGKNNETSVFGDDFVERTQGLKDASYSLTGFYDNTDTNGQLAIRAAWLADSPLYIKVSYDTSSFYHQRVKVKSFNPSAKVDGVVELKMDLEGTGALTII
jgi:predicted secreted protein